MGFWLNSSLVVCNLAAPPHPKQLGGEWLEYRLYACKMLLELVSFPLGKVVGCLCCRPAPDHQPWEQLVSRKETISFRGTLPGQHSTGLVAKPHSPPRSRPLLLLRKGYFSKERSGNRCVPWWYSFCVWNNNATWLLEKELNIAGCSNDFFMRMIIKRLIHLMTVFN